MADSEVYDVKMCIILLFQPHGGNKKGRRHILLLNLLKDNRD